MENERNLCERIRVVPLHTAQRIIDPAELWLDQDISPEMLIKLDPLDIDHEMVEQAEQPELADPLLTGLSDTASTLRAERVWLKMLWAQPRDEDARHRLIQKLSGLNADFRARDCGLVFVLRWGLFGLMYGGLRGRRLQYSVIN